MLPFQVAIGREEQSRAIQSAALSLNYADDKIDCMSSSDLAESRSLVTRYNDRRIPIAPEIIASFGGTRADARTEIDALGIASQKSFGKNDEGCTCGLRLRAIVSEFLDRSRSVENVGTRLNYCGSNFLHVGPTLVACVRGQQNTFLHWSLYGIHHHLRHSLAMIGCVAECDFRGFRAPVIEVRIVLPGKAHATVDLDRAVTHFAIRVAGVRLCYGHPKVRLRDALVQRPGCVESCGSRTLGVQQHVCALMLHCLELPNRPSKLVPCIGG